MSFLSKLFGKRSPAETAAAAADRARQQRLPSQEAFQTDDERATIRRTMEAELDAARAKRNAGSAD